MITNVINQLTVVVQSGTVYIQISQVITVYLNSVVFSCKFHSCHGLILEDFSLMNLTINFVLTYACQLIAQ